MPTITHSPTRTMPPDTGHKRMFLLAPNVAEQAEGFALEVQRLLAQGTEVVTVAPDSHGNFWFTLHQPDPQPTT